MKSNRGLAKSSTSISEESSRGWSWSVQGSRIVNVLPFPSALSTETSPPRSLHSSLTIDKPRPEPEYSRVMASPLGATVRPWRNFSKIAC